MLHQNKRMERSKLDKLDTPEKIEKAILDRQTMLDALYPFKDWHFKKGKEYRNIEHSLHQLRQRLERMKDESNKDI